ncbi:MAG: FAD-dependent oxidoreductase [Candidatus Woesearchaeota archaeon]
MEYDTIIIGSGVAGLAAGMYAGRLGLKTLIIGDMHGGTITLTHVVENYPGFKSISGQELAEKLKEHALDYKEFVDLKDGVVEKIEKDGKKFKVKTSDSIFTGKTIIMATGTKWRELDVEGNDKYKNKGVHFCALCDGFFYRNKITAVVGGGDSAAKDALVLSEHCKKVYILVRGDKFTPEPINLKRVQQTKNIEVMLNVEVEKILGDEKGVTGVLLKTKNGKQELKIDGLFTAIGHIALSDLAKGLVELNEKGEIKINRKSETSLPGFYAAGDVTDSHFKQAITGVAEGVIAAHSAYNYVKSNF